MTAGMRPLRAQTCTTQARMQQSERDALASAGLALGAAVKADDMAALKAGTIPEFSNNFSGIESAARSAGGKLGGDTLRVVQVYDLDATARKAGDTSEADFSCLLKDSTAETDFAIASLPRGHYAFVMVEAAGGERPWVLSFILQQTGAEWKMAGFYPHARTAAGHDGLWYWTAARMQAKSSKPWLAWLDYGEAAALLEPASFVSSTQLDKLVAEQRSGAPPELSDGLNAQTPLVVKGANGEEFHFTAMSSEDAADDKSLHLVARFAADALPDPAAARARNTAAARALIGAHPELREGYSEVLVFADVPQQAPLVVMLPMSDLK